MGELQTAQCAVLPDSTDNIHFTVSARADAKGRVTIPKDVRAALGLVPGGRVTFIVDGNHVRVVNIALQALSELQAALTGAAEEAGLPDESAVSRWITETRRKERAK